MYHYRSQFAVVLAIVVVALITTFFGQAVLAQSTSPTAQAGEIEITGKVTEFSGLTITLLGQVIDINKAEFYGSFSVGDVVKVKATLNSDGTLTAIEVEPAQASASDNSNDNSASNTNDNSDDNASDNANNNSNDNVDDNGVDFQQEFELSGTVTEIGADYLIVSGLRLQTTGARIEGAMTVGATVRAKIRLVNNAYVAARIELRSSGDDRVLPANCVVRAPAGGPTYAGQFGAPRSGSAAWSGAKLADIVSTNCISNPNRVAVGTVLFVPREPQPLAGNDNSNDNRDDHGDDNGNNNANDNGDDHSNDNGDDHSNDNSGDHSNDNGGDHSNDNGDNHGGDNGNDD
jgi:hypothetical protein